MPPDCMNEYVIVGPTKVIPRFLRSLLIATDSGVATAGTSFIEAKSGCSGFESRTNDQK